MGLDLWGGVLTMVLCDVRSEKTVDYHSKFKGFHFREVPKPTHGGRKPRTVRVVTDNTYDVGAVVVDGRGLHKPLTIFRKHLVDPERWVPHPTVVVNGTEQLVLASKLTYDRACQLAGFRPASEPTVTWSMGGTEGVLGDAESIDLVEGLVVRVF